MKYILKKICLSLAAALAVAQLVLGAVTFSHATLTYNEWEPFPGNPFVPLGITAIFTTVTTGHVTLKMSVADGIPDSIKVKEFGFNYVGVLGDASNRDVEYRSGSDGLQATRVFTGYDKHTRAGGDGYFNLYFELPTSGITLSTGRELVYDLYGMDLTENNFMLLKSAQYVHGTYTPTLDGYYSTIHVLGLPPTDLGSWAGATTYYHAPIPGAAWLLASGMIALAVIRWRIKIKQGR